MTGNKNRNPPHPPTPPPRAPRGGEEESVLGGRDGSCQSSSHRDKPGGDGHEMPNWHLKEWESVLGGRDSSCQSSFHRHRVGGDESALGRLSSALCSANKLKIYKKSRLTNVPNMVLLVLNEYWRYQA